ncbi:acetate kinase [Streptococcus phocae subsp. salmonis]|uniref:acetate kinase n=1 Tax=Streptococcus phocae TaxID=119224 RepID=UPI0005317065|nr:acetate kinase [Streptococcus phocae]KGR73396.1 acetate kinase [Streptococcus phocae subsp. salmonis]
MIENLLDLIRYHDQQIASRSLSGKLGLNQAVTLYAMDQGETISNESSPKAKLILVLEGQLGITQEAQDIQLSAGGVISLMPEQVHHLTAITQCKYLQIILD